MYLPRIFLFGIVLICFINSAFAKNNLRVETGFNYINKSTLEYSAFSNTKPENYALSPFLGINAGPTLYVDINNPNATDARSGLSNYSEDVPFKSITAALTAAVSNDVVYVRSGTYNEAINMGSTNRNLNIIYDHVTQIAGSTSAIMLTTVNYSAINFTLINSKISNTGNAADRIGSSTINIGVTNYDLTITGVGSSTISSQEGTAVSLTTNTGGGNLYLNNLIISSINSTVLNTPTQNEGVSIVNCNLTSTNNSAITKARWVYVYNSSINTYTTSISGVSWAYLNLQNSNISSSNGNGVVGNSNLNSPAWSSFCRIENCNFFTYNEAIYTLTAAPWYSNSGKIRNCYFEIKNPSISYTLGWDGDAGVGVIGSGVESMWECDGNKSNKPLSNPGFTKINVRNQFFTYIDHATATNESNVEINNRGTTTISSPLVLNNSLILSNKSADPSPVTNGTLYYNTASQTFKGYQNGAWKNILTGTSTDGSGDFIRNQSATRQTATAWITGPFNIKSAQLRTEQPGGTDDGLSVLAIQSFGAKFYNYDGSKLLDINSGGSTFYGSANTPAGGSPGLNVTGYLTTDRIYTRWPVNFAKTATDFVLPTRGDTYYNTSTNTFRGYANNAWKNFLMQEDASALLTNVWSFNGNAGTNEAQNFLGTSDNHPLILKAFNNEGLRISTDGSVLIGTSNNVQGYKLAVNGDALFTKVKVKASSAWPDYVFNKDYKLTPLEYVENYIASHQHLPGVKSAEQVKNEGLDVAENQAELLKKVEELTLYIIELNKKVNSLEKKNEVLNRKVAKLRK